MIGETRRENFVNHFPDQKTFRVFRGKHPRAREDCPRLVRQISAHFRQKLPLFILLILVKNSPHRNLIFPTYRGQALLTRGRSFYFLVE